MEHEDDDNASIGNEDPYEVDLPEQLPVPHSDLLELFLFMSKAREEEDKTVSMVRHYMNELYDEYSVEFPERDSEVVAAEIVSYLCRRHKWDVELLWDRKDVEEMLFRRFNTYDPNIWAKVMETEAMQEMHRAVYAVTQRFLDAAIQEVIRPERRTPKSKFGKRRQNRRRD
jgi:hypothetical protein